MRPVQPPEIARFDELVVAHHHLKNARVVGEHVRYVATYQGHWLGLATWSAAALHLKARAAVIGWTEEHRRGRLPRVANNARLLILPAGHYPNLVSRFMKLLLARRASDWPARWGHPLALAESFVAPQLYRGPACKVSGWSQLGRTAGWQRRAADFYQKQDRPKQIWVRELVPKACVKLRAPPLPPEWAHGAAAAPPHCTAPAEELRRLVATLRAEGPEFRAKKALAYPLAGRLARSAQAMFSGVRRGPQDLAEYAATLSQGQLRALGFRPKRQPGRLRCPGVPPFRDVLLGVDAAALERALLRWQEQLLGPAQDPLVSVDGKALRHAPGELVSAVNGAGRWLGPVAVPEQSNEIPAARALLGRGDLCGKTARADALHPQTETGQQILFAGGGDDALTGKANQKELRHTLATLLAPGDFFPSAHGAAPGADAGTQSGPPGDSPPGRPGGPPGTGRFSRRPAARPAAPAGAPQRQEKHRTGVLDQQPDPGATGRAGLAQTQTRRLGDREPAASRAGRFAGRRSQPGAPAPGGAGAGNVSPTGGQCGPNGACPGANAKAALDRAALSTTLCSSGRGARTPPRAGVRQFPDSVALTQMKKCGLAACRT